MKPTMGRVKRVAATGAAGGLALLGLALSSHVVLAGSAWPTPSSYCTDGMGSEFAEVPILSGPPSPVSLSVEIGDNGTTPSGSTTALENLHVAVCYSDTAPGTPSSLAGGDISVFGPQVGSGNLTPHADGGCINDAGVVIQPDCGFTITATVTPTTGSCGLACGATVTVSIPFVVCAGAAAGVHTVGPICTDQTGVNEIPVGATGLLVSSIGIGPGPNGSLGASTPTTTLSVDGISLPLTTGAGVVPGTVSAGGGQTTNQGLCLGQLGCFAAYANVASGPDAYLTIPEIGTIPLSPLAPAAGCYEVNDPSCPPPSLVSLP